MSGEAMGRTLAKEDIYIRGGNYADTNYYETKKESGSLEIKHDQGGYNRYFSVCQRP